MRISDWSSDVCSSDLRAARYNGKRTTMAKPLNISPDRLFPAEDKTRDIARALYAGVKALPIVSPHGHTDPAWFATDANWRSEEHTSELQSLMRISYAVFCLKENTREGGFTEAVAHGKLRPSIPASCRGTGTYD